LNAELEELQRYKVLAQTAIETKAWAERTEILLAEERQVSSERRQWAERAEAHAANEQENARQMRDWAEHRISLLEAEIVPLQHFAERFKWLFRIFLKIKYRGFNLFWK
jgi:hypothetical protein